MPYFLYSIYDDATPVELLEEQDDLDGARKARNRYDRSRGPNDNFFVDFFYAGSEEEARAKARTRHDEWLATLGKAES
ncbi:MAG: hypothetical protein P8182_11080 [Deltaproteobacteria bacterium]